MILYIYINIYIDGLGQGWIGSQAVLLENRVPRLVHVGKVTLMGITIVVSPTSGYGAPITMGIEQLISRTAPPSKLLCALSSLCFFGYITVYDSTYECGDSSS